MSDSIRIIAAYAGTGKTTLAAKYPDTMIDFLAVHSKISPRFPVAQNRAAHTAAAKCSFV
ncbi:MAG: ATP-binding protein [Oscillospiraceae bacterium]|nr:ATP-binding protein [Oscillospiraceae bacterium]